MPASTDALRSYSGGGLCFFSLPPFEIHVFRVCAVVLRVWLRSALPFWQVSSICKGWTGSAFGLESPGDKGLEVLPTWSVSVLSPGFHVSLSHWCAVAYGAFNIIP